MPTNKNKSKLIAVAGATGKQGGAALRHLVERGFAVRGLTRDPSKPEARRIAGPGMEIVRADMDDPASLDRALDGAYGVFSVQQPHEAGIEGEVRQGINVAEAARRARVSHLVYCSVGSADQNTGIPHFDSKFQIEEHIRRTGVHFTILRPVFFMENWLGMREAITNGTLAQPLEPATRLQMVAVDDIGGMAATAFEHAGKWQDQAIELAGDELSMEELAQVFTRVAGREVGYVKVPWADFEGQAGREYALMYRWFQDTGYHADIPAVRQAYPKLMTFTRWVNSNWHGATRSA
jgi:uncharacterized protein YbjT (DUF2867 family)